MEVIIAWVVGVICGSIFTVLNLWQRGLLKLEDDKK